MPQYLPGLLMLLMMVACSDQDPQPALPPYDNSWISRPQSEWPQIAMINEVWYRDSQRYIHPSFDYAGTGFLIDTGTDTLAATAKHVLWIARHDAMRAVDPGPWLTKWIMHPKGNVADSVVIGQLMNADTTELLQGRNATIQERDWIVFTTTSVSPNIQPLRPAFRQVVPGERLFFASCPYQDSTCVTGLGVVRSAQGNRIVFSKEDSTFNASGASGSPLLDSAGYLIGIFGGTSVDPADGGDAFYGISTHYLRKVLERDPDLNEALIPIDGHFLRRVSEVGVEAAIMQTEAIVADPQSYFRYSMSPEAFIGLAADYLDQGQPEFGIRVMRVAMQVHPNFSRSHSMLGVLFSKTGQTDSARTAFNQALALWPENEEAKGGLSALNR
ncbi:MAG: trypsin-like peptidase domain-containing protein [Saprospiraceae bacterium]|nr:trypsin-like peptidase domain-containing protein [Saprospiraceae bacterium]